MGVFDFWKKLSPARPSLPQSLSESQNIAAPASVDTYLPEVTCIVSADGKQTRIQSPDFLLELPFRWDQVPNKESLEFQNPLFSEQLIITARRTRQHLSLKERRLLVSKILETHQRAMERASPGKVRISPPEQVHRDPDSEGRFYAKGPEMNMALGVRYTPDRVFTFSIYRYSNQNFGMPFGVYSGAMLDLLKVL